MTTVAVTGITGFFAQSIVPRLEADPEVERIVGIDVMPPDSSSSKVEFHRMDIRDDGIAKLFESVDTVLHMAFIVAEIHDKKKTHDINFGGTRNVIEACARAGVSKVVIASSVAAYGSNPDNPIGMTEEQPLRPNPDSYYSTDKAAVEEMVASFASAHPDITVTVLRPPIVVGPGAQFLMDTLKVQARFGLAGRNPESQWLHEEDLGQAFYAAVTQDLPGIFNVAPDDYISLSESYEILGFRPIRLPAGVMKFMANLLFRLRLINVSRGWVSLSEYPCVMSNDKLKEASGWRPRFSSGQALRDFAKMTSA